VSALSFDQVSIKLGGRTILAAVSFAIQNGEFIGMLGANGAGKTTLMRAALGLVPLSGGAISILGRPATRGNGAIGYMPQARGNVSGLRLTGYDIVASAAGGAGWGLPRLDAATRSEIDWALEMVDAVLGRPKLLLLDEPLISLDPGHQKSVVEIVRRLRDELKIAIVFSAHELNPLIHAIDRVLYLGAGKAVLGAVDEVITGPVLSRLYGTDIEVVRIKDRVFVMAGDVDVERDAHRHDEDSSHHHDHGHGQHDHDGAHV
jgi:zinc/manganese transport system ATP-binding protein